MLGAIIGGAASLAGGIAGLFGQKKQQEENREYNKELARMQNQWNLEQWQRENVYNTPAAQRARLRAAGMNPDLASGGAGGVAASSPTFTSGAPSSPVDYSSFIPSPSEMSSAVDTFASLRKKQDLLDAEVENKQADTDVKKGTSDILASDAAFRDAYNKNVLDLQGADIKLKGSADTLNDSQVKMLRASTNKIDIESKNLIASYDEIKARIANIDADTYKKGVDAFLAEKMTNASVKKMAAETNLTTEQCRDLLRTQMYRIANLQAENSEIRAKTANISMGTDKLSFDLSSDMQFKDMERALNMVNGTLKNSAGVMRDLIPFLNKYSKKK